MNKDEHGLKHGAITEVILRVFYEVYGELGYGFLESVYEAAMAMALPQAGLQVVRQPVIPVYFRGVLIGEFKADLLVNSLVIVELKAAKGLDTGHEAQLLNELRATPIEVGMLLNFGPTPQYKRRLFTNDRKQIRVHPCSSVANPLSPDGVDFGFEEV